MKTLVYAFGRMNPPTAGHGKLVQKVKQLARVSCAAFEHKPQSKLPAAFLLLPWPDRFATVVPECRIRISRKPGAPVAGHQKALCGYSSCITSGWNS